MEAVCFDSNSNLTTRWIANSCSKTERKKKKKGKIHSEQSPQNGDVIVLKKKTTPLKSVTG
jgi:hypothetical protein